MLAIGLVGRGAEWRHAEKIFHNAYLQNAASRWGNDATGHGFEEETAQRNMGRRAWWWVAKTLIGHAEESPNQVTCPPQGSRRK